MTTALLPIIERTRAGDDAAFAVLVDQYKDQVFRWAVALSGDADEAEDITQEVFVRVYGKISSFKGDGSFDGWLYRITRRVLLRSRRDSMRRAALLKPATRDVYTTDPGARVDRERSVALVRQIADTLPMRQREVFTLCDLDGRAPAEVADLLGMNDATVRANLFKARATIRKSILATHPRYIEERQ